jgi:AraC-like DNA-binding protein
VSERPVTIESRGAWHMVSTPWHPALRPFLHGYVGYWEDSRTPVRMRTFPSGHVVVVINLADPLRMVSTPHPGFTSASFPALLAGMDDGPGVYEHSGRQEGIQLDLTPLGTYRLFGMPMREVTNLVVDLADLLGPDARTLVDRLRETPDWPTRFDILDALLLSRLAEGPEPAPEVREAMRLLAQSGGTVPVASLAAEIGWSRKHLVTRFNEQVGLPPKTMARVLRFRRALDMMTHGVPGFVNIAVACGYYDQAHLIREFRDLTGCTPRELLAAHLGDSTAEIPA